jgi:hypothetical protein
MSRGIETESEVARHKACRILPCYLKACHILSRAKRALHARHAPITYHLSPVSHECLEQVSEHACRGRESSTSSMRV